MQRELTSPRRTLTSHSPFIDHQGDRFHNTINDWVEAITGLPLMMAWGQCVYTNMVKCTTEGNALPCKMAVHECSQRWFRDEVALRQPKVIVGMGGFAVKALTSLGIACFPMPHPSHREGKQYERQYLDALVARLGDLRK